MKKILFILSLSLLLTACHNKSVQLPQIPAKGVTDVYNHSQIWAFYKEKDNNVIADVNKNNIITTTHWIINIDKRLPMSQVAPVLTMIQAKRAKRTVHSVDGMHNYLNFADVKNKTNALLEIDSLKITTLKANELKGFQQNHKNNYIVLMPEHLTVNDMTKTYDDINDSIVNILSSEAVVLCYDESISYQRYLESKVLLHNILPEDCALNPEEFCLTKD
ncbi:MAG: hypothetical protein CR968_06445 [Flavobacteriia bacterium]|nr:MAG: hypothetical protein CR968_06445 [Flavobacteriia bacterium]